MEGIGSMRGLGANFGRLWTASAVSNLGDGILYTAAPLLAATLTRDPFLVAFAMFARNLPWLLFSLVSGALVDRLDRRQVMGAMNYVRAGAVGLLSVAVLLDLATLPLLYAVFFVVGVSETLFETASQTILPGIVPRERLELANGRLESARVVANDVVGPSLGGVLFAVAAAVPLLLNAGAFAAAAALVLALRGGFRARGSELVSVSGVVSDVREGLEWLWRHRELRALAGASAVVGLVDEAVFAVFVLYALEVLGVREVGYGILIAVGAIGGILGGLTASGIVRRLGSGGAILLSLVVGAVSYLGLALGGGVVFVAAMLVVNLFHVVLWNITTLSLRQNLVPEELLGRVNSAYRFLMMAGVSAGALAGGAVAGVFGLVAPFWFGAGALALMSAYGLFALVKSRRS
jgi:MFS family permease